MSFSGPRLAGRRLATATPRSAGHKLTLSSPRSVHGGCVDGESLCPPGQAPPSLLGDGGAGGTPLLRSMLSIGRASLGRPRAIGFEPVDEVDPEEQQRRTARTRKANERRAVRRAADHAMESVCTVLMSGTLDETEDPRLAVREAQQFGHAISNTYGDAIGGRCRYVGVVVTEGPIFRLHMVLSRDVSEDLIEECWTGCDDLSVSMIDRAEIERTVYEMAEMGSGRRLGSHRFIRSRGPRPAAVVVEVADIDEAREILCQQIAPQEPVLVSASPFGRSPHATFRFAPITDD